MGAKNKEVATVITTVADAIDSDPAQVQFMDGSTVALTDLTVGEWKEISVGRATASTAGDLWTGEHTATHNRLCVRLKKDRGQIYILTEQNKQIQQVRVNALGEGKEETVLAKFKELAIQYSENVIGDKVELNRKKCDMFSTPPRLHAKKEAGRGHAEGRQQ